MEVNGGEKVGRKSDQSRTPGAGGGEGDLEKDGPMGRAVARGNEITNCTAGRPRERMTDADADQGEGMHNWKIWENKSVFTVQSGRSFWTETSTEGRAQQSQKITLL